MKYYDLMYLYSSITRLETTKSLLKHERDEQIRVLVKTWQFYLERFYWNDFVIRKKKIEIETSAFINAIVWFIFEKVNYIYK